MRIAVTTLITLTIGLGLSPLLLASESARLLAEFRAHCISCHGEDGTFEGDVDLHAVSSAGKLLEQPELLHTLIRVLNDREMPPQDAPTLSTTTRQQMVEELQKLLNESLESQPFLPVPIRRMNRFQYNNAVVDLLELDRDIFQLNERFLRRRDDYFRPATRKMPDQVRVSSRPLAKDIDNERPEGFRAVAAFPQDQRAEHGFDNRADHLTLSPLLMESFLKLSQTIVESPDLNPRECRSWNRLFAPPGQPVDESVDGRYEAETGGPMTLNGRPKGRAARQEMRSFGNEWSGNAQLFWLCPQPQQELKLSFKVSTPGSGLRFGFTQAPDYGNFSIHFDDTLLDSIDLYGPKVARTTHEVPASVTVGMHTLTFRCTGRNERSTRYFFGLDFVDVTGREPVPNVDVEPADLPVAIRHQVSKLLRRAFRRPAEVDTINRFAAFAEQQLASGKSFEDTMRTVVGAILSMPDFLYLYEATGSGDDPNEVGSGRQRVTDFELASRLSQFFWSSIPDETLLDLAESGSLSHPAELERQIDRMMNDVRSSRFCDNFPGQWLQLDRLITSIPDPKKFPYFYYLGYRTSIHMMSEPLLLFDTVYIEDRSILDLLDPDFTWQSDMLRQNYEGKSETGHDVRVQLFKRTTIDDPRRGGVITNAAVMTMTSTPTRTQPITRGAWINAVIFNDPPEPPPADVPPLPEVDREELEKLTIRERLAVHRKRADCAGCHNRIDPLGFAMENYGPTGIWRDNYENGRDVDPSGVLFNQHEFKTVAEFKRLLVLEKQRFIRGFVAHLLSYALGRELGPADWPALDQMTSEAMQGRDQLRSVLKSVAMSEPFLHKNTVTQGLKH